MNASKVKGTRFETEVVSYLNAHGFPYAERRALHGTDDRGDVAGLPSWVLECKAHASITLADFMDEVVVEKANAGAPFGAAIVKRRNKSVERAYVVIELRDFVEALV